MQLKQNYSTVYQVCMRPYDILEFLMRYEIGWYIWDYQAYSSKRLPRKQEPRKTGRAEVQGFLRTQYGTALYVPTWGLGLQTPFSYLEVPECVPSSNLGVPGTCHTAHVRLNLPAALSLRVLTRTCATNSASYTSTNRLRYAQYKILIVGLFELPVPT